MYDTTVTVSRVVSGAVTTVATHLPVQVDQANMQETVLHHQAYSFQGGDLWKIYTIYWTPTLRLQQDDVLTDERVTDPNTATYQRYKLVGRVKYYEFDHLELYAYSEVGT